MNMNKVNGSLSREEARRVQLLKYQQDVIEHAEKEKEKRNKKLAEKLKRYEHIDLGEKLTSVSGHTEEVVRNQQQSLQDDKVINYILKLERENARLRTEEQKRKESSLASTSSANTSNINHCQTQSPRLYVERIPFETNSVANSPSLRSSNVSSPVTPVNRHLFGESSAHVHVQKSPTMNVSDSNTTQDEEELDKLKQETYKRNMELVREKMQKMYSQQLNNDD